MAGQEDIACVKEKMQSTLISIYIYIYISSTTLIYNIIEMQMRMCFAKGRIARPSSQGRLLPLI